MREILENLTRFSYPEFKMRSRLPRTQSPNLRLSTTKRLSRWKSTRDRVHSKPHLGKRLLQCLRPRKRTIGSMKFQPFSSARKSKLNSIRIPRQDKLWATSRPLSSSISFWTFKTKETSMLRGRKTTEVSSMITSTQWASQGSRLTWQAGSTLCQTC